jgi:exosortase/archaeosortase family protein
MTKLIFFIRKNKLFLIKFLVFIAFVYVLIPLFFKQLSLKPTFESKFFLLPYSLLVIALFIAFNKKELFKFDFKTKKLEFLIFFILSVISYYLFFLFKYKILLSNLNEIYFAIIFYFLGTLFFALALFNVRFFLKFHVSLLLSFIITLFFSVFNLFLNFIWPFLSKIVAKANYLLLRLAYSSVGLSFEKLAPLIKLNQFSVYIGQACSGIESIALLTSLTLLAVIYDFEKINFKRLFLIFPIALIGIFIVNILRVCFIIILGSYYPEFALSLFHSNIGWVFFAIYTLIFAYFAYPYIISKHRKI